MDIRAVRLFDAVYIPSVSTVCALLAEDAPVFRSPSALTLHLQNYSGNPTDSLGANEVPLRGALQRAVVVQALGPNSGFLWVTRGTPIWGREAGLKRFEALYHGTWHLEPNAAELQVTMLSSDVAQLYVPIVFTIGSAGQAAQTTRVLMNQTNHQDTRRMEGGEHAADPSSCPGRGHPLIGWTRSPRVGGSIRMTFRRLRVDLGVHTDALPLGPTIPPYECPVLIDGTCSARLRSGHSFLHLISGSKVR